MGWHVVLLSVVLGSSAFAEDQSRTGLQPAVFVGGGGFVPSSFMTNWAAARRDPSVAIHALIVYRVFPSVDAGVHLAHQWLKVTGLPEGGTAYASAAGSGLVVRFHPLSLANIEWIDPSIGFGFDMFAYSRQSTRLPLDTDSDQRNAISGAALPFIAALDLVLVKGLALSAIGMWSPWWFAENCSSQGTAIPVCQPSPAGPEQYLFFGLGLRLHLQFVS